MKAIALIALLTLSWSCSRFPDGNPLYEDVCDVFQIDCKECSNGDDVNKRIEGLFADVKSREDFLKLLTEKNLIENPKVRLSNDIDGENKYSTASVQSDDGQSLHVYFMEDAKGAFHGPYITLSAFGTIGDY